MPVELSVVEQRYQAVTVIDPPDSRRITRQRLRGGGGSLESDEADMSSPQR